MPQVPEVPQVPLPEAPVRPEWPMPGQSGPGNGFGSPGGSPLPDPGFDRSSPQEGGTRNGHGGNGFGSPGQFGGGYPDASTRPDSPAPHYDPPLNGSHGGESGGRNGDQQAPWSNGHPQQNGTPSNGSQAAMGTPGAPGPAASSAPARPSRSLPRASMFGNGRGGESAQPRRNAIVVRSHTGFGEFSEMDLGTGDLRAVNSGLGPVGGVYGSLGETPVVFYRDGARLILRAAGRTVDLDATNVGVEWQRIDERTTRFVLTVGGATVCDVRYRAVAPDLDLGLLIRDVLSDPSRRSRIFSA
ncbi:hypothetical protein [Nocardia sp. NPDC050793]|uniref:hypothetical protein n=1 Tax=Nocardia sp. NPDC050793 TaxID=3155159 RepID=UPI0033F77F4E